MSTNPRALRTEQSLPTRRLGTTDMYITIRRRQEADR